MTLGKYRRELKLCQQPIFVIAPMVMLGGF